MNNKSKGCCSCFKAMFGGQSKPAQSNKPEENNKKSVPIEKPTEVSKKSPPHSEIKEKKPEKKIPASDPAPKKRETTKSTAKQSTVNAETFPLDESSISLRVSNEISVSNDVVFYDKNSGSNQTYDKEQARCNLDEAFHMIQADNGKSSEMSSEHLTFGKDALNSSFINSNSEVSDEGKEQFTKVIKNINFKDLLEEEESRRSKEEE
ncbi:unnamed protein product [Blepharisma stoltei]|uniref:Uncharacterized protein n=1 Tax=Blepharisma stoltei TaxID=1481888 RepID=A0AAU9JJ81_9CILI|nr:unnamed protein product [Blepharisma stoltei]